MIRTDINMHIRANQLRDCSEAVIEFRFFLEVPNLEKPVWILWHCVLVIIALERNRFNRPTAI